jgi:hypothetical protein
MALVGPNSIEIALPTPVGARPEATPNRGERRIVKFVETALGWGWVLWTSPYTVEDTESNPQDRSLWPCRVCVVLVGKGPPKPEPVIMTIPIIILAKYPEAAVEW